ncbi:sialate O-acetylesterase [Paenibacillus sp. sgz5001063]|uniref:sialate O-acetylesterase n=1 Tax=Paenibacillus sp. sgz5001063 TaxID=3242474 RepID=UPI0036D22A46
MQSLKKIRLARLFGDGMVLQRNSCVKIWGWAPAGEVVNVRFKDLIYSGIAAMDGRWQVSLQTGDAGGPFEMIIESRDGTERLRLVNILLGDVWLCSGQSNMEMKMVSLQQAFPEDIANAGNDAIRQLLIPVVYNFEQPCADIESGRWEAADAISIMNFSAAAYYFAAKLYEQNGVPIGLIQASLGGAPIEAFMSEEALAPFPNAAEELRKLKDKKYLESLAQEDQVNQEQWYGYVNQNDAGLAVGGTPYYDPAFNASDWSSIPVPSYWEEEGLGSFNGSVWFRKEFEVHSGELGLPAMLELGNVVDEDTVYLNGVQIGALTSQYISRVYSIPEGLLQRGGNTIVVRVVNVSGKGGFYKGKPYRLQIGERSLDLSGDWQYQIGVKCGPMPAPSFVQWRPAGLYNGMIAPVAPYSLKGIIWYQGESNLNNPELYESLFQTLIADWREKWGMDDLPFLYVQLPNFSEPSDSPAESQWAKLREVQRKTLAVSMTGMAVAIDIGESNDIHPVNKKDIGYRLALAARRVVYKEDAVVASGPLFQFAEKVGQRMILHFSNTGGGLVAKNGDTLKHFAIAGVGQPFIWANASIEDDCVVVWHDEIPDPAQVRYAWADNPDTANLYNREGLPASPFSTV